ncbi:MAG: histidine phosphatase family protein [Spirochaetales bacterium]|nr:histidine phosphatase family protein [Spirochaetales bacterium]
MFVYVVRHGQSESNRDRRFPTGKVHLTEKGIEDAKKAGTILAPVSFAHIYASDYIRALETARYAVPGCSPVADPRLRECDYGSLSGLEFSYVQDRFGQEYAENHTRRDYRPYGGECSHQQIERVKSFVMDLEKLDGDSNVAVFCHEGTVKSFLCAALDQELNFRKIRCDNGSVSVFEFKAGKWLLCKWNLTSGQDLPSAR